MVEWKLIGERTFSVTVQPPSTPPISQTLMFDVRPIATSVEQGSYLMFNVMITSPKDNPAVTYFRVTVQVDTYSETEVWNGVITNGQTLTRRVSVPTSNLSTGTHKVTFRLYIRANPPKSHTPYPV